MSKDVASLMDAVNGELEDLLGSLNKTLKNAEALTGETADLIETNRGDIEELLVELGATLRNLSDFTKTLREHPDAILKGKEKEGRW